jgi:hypothetical protein
MANGRKTHAVNIRQRNSVSAVTFADRGPEQLATRAHLED